MVEALSEVAIWLQTDERAGDLASALVAGDQNRVAEVVAGIVGNYVGGPTAAVVASGLMHRYRNWIAENSATHRLLRADASEDQAEERRRALEDFQRWLATSISSEINASQREQHELTRAAVDDAHEQLARITQGTDVKVSRIAAIVERDATRLEADARLNERFDVVRGLLQAANPTAARDALKRIAADHDLESASVPVRHRWMNQSGIVALELGDFDRAIELLDKAQVLEPKNASTLPNLAIAHAMNGNQERAEFWSRRATEAHPEDSAAWGVRVQCDAQFGSKRYLQTSRHPNQL